MEDLGRHLEALRIKGRRLSVMGGHAFMRKGPFVAPFGPAAEDYTIGPSVARSLLATLGGLWVQWTDGFEGASTTHGEMKSEWYAVVCRRHVEIDRVKSANTRSKLRRAIKNCVVRKVDALEIAGKGYESYIAAFSRYRGWSGSLPNLDAFTKAVMSDAPFDDVRHQWAVYCDEMMVGFAQVLVYGRREADYTLIKLHPDYLKYYSGYALVYKMNEFYLEKEGFEYVTDGFRSVLHDTGVQEFLISKFGFDRAYCGLHVHYRFPLGVMVAMARPLRRWITKMHPGAGALLEMDRLRAK